MKLIFFNLQKPYKYGCLKRMIFLIYLTKHYFMPKKDPWHSTKQNVHHNNSNCNTGNNIERENLKQGTGNKPLCSECEKLSRDNK